MGNSSKGEEKIKRILYNHKVKFKTEITFKNLTGANGVPLRFDFGVFNSNNQLIALIEYDGIQHFEYTPYFHKTKAAFRRQVEWDRKKNKFCLLNRIPLIRIPYWDYDIITYNRIFSTPAYLVKNKEHNTMLAREVKK